jgi:cell division protein ZapD
LPLESDKVRAVILYEYPFNERIRTYFAPGASFRRLGPPQRHSPSTDHHYAITTILKSWTSVRGLI